jgi:hypothetical protein
VNFPFIFSNKKIGLVSFRFSCEALLIQIKEQVGKKRRTLCTHRYADCLLKNRFTNHSKYVVNQKLEHDVDSFIPWPTPRNWQWGSVKNETLRKKRWFPFSHCELSICSNIPAAPAYGVHVYIFQLKRHSRACGSYQDGRVSSSCSISGTRRVDLVTNPVASHEWGKNWEVLTTSGTYPWSFVTHVFRNE